MAFDYTLSKIKTEALHYVRFRIGAVKRDHVILKLENEEIEAALDGHGVSATGDPTSNRKAILQTLADLCRSLGQRLVGDVVVPEVGAPRAESARLLFSQADKYEHEAESPAEDGPWEEIDSLDYRVGAYGGDGSERVGDPV